MVKKGDTLIEVTIAIGIFSMIAIGVASVMSSGSSGSQTALETTLAREEIDVQAEALRFIHSARISSRSDADNPYDTIWNTITASAIDGSTMDASTAQFNPSSCQALYSRDNDDSVFSQHAFILNPRALGSSQKGLFRASEASDAAVFTPTTTHPRLIYDASGNNLQAEGIYVVAVKDSGTNIVGYDNAEPAFYDFYIRTCWYGTDNDRPSTISTVIRLYSPPAVKSETSVTNHKEITIKYCDNNECEKRVFNPFDETIKVEETTDVEPVPAYPIRFQYWMDMENGVNRYVGGENSTVTYEPTDRNTNQIWRFVANWDTTPNKINYNANGGKFSNNKTRETKQCAIFTECDKQDTVGFTFKIDSSVVPSRDGYNFLGWADSAGATSPTRSSGTTYSVDGRTIDLYAVWQPRYIQDFTNQACSKQEEATTANQKYSLVDRRDNKVYYVHYASNKCWMVSDLDISGTVSSQYSNFTSPSSVNVNASSSASYTLPYKSGLYYNFCAATAANSSGCSKTANYTASTDICPSGWRLPNGTEIAGVRNNRDIFPTSITYGDWWTTTSVGLADNGSGMLMCLLIKQSNSSSFTFVQGFTSCTQRDASGAYWGYNRLESSRIRCVHR